MSDGQTRQRPRLVQIRDSSRWLVRGSQQPTQVGNGQWLDRLTGYVEAGSMLPVRYHVSCSQLRDSPAPASYRIDRLGGGGVGEVLVQSQLRPRYSSTIPCY